MRSRDYVASARYGYGAIDEYAIVAENGDVRRICMRTTVAGITQKLSRSLAIELNVAYMGGISDIKEALSESGLLTDEVNAIIRRVASRITDEGGEDE